MNARADMNDAAPVPQEIDAPSPYRHFTRGEWANRSESYRQRRRKGIMPNTPARAVEDE